MKSFVYFSKVTYSSAALIFFLAVVLVTGCGSLARPSYDPAQGSAMLGATGQTFDSFRLNWNEGAKATGLPLITERPIDVTEDNRYWFDLMPGIKLMAWYHKTEQSYFIRQIGMDLGDSEELGQKICKNFVYSIFPKNGNQNPESILAQLTLSEVFKAVKAPPSGLVGGVKKPGLLAKTVSVGKTTLDLSVLPNNKILIFASFKP